MERRKPGKPKEDSSMKIVEEIEAPKGSNLKGDRMNIALLFFLYTLQGIPLGLSSVIPMVLQNRGASYKQQAEFSFVSWPFSLKLMWAPIVDSMFSSRLGRRKTWLVPTQYLIGAFMLLLSCYIDRWMGDGNGSEPNIAILTILFFSLNFLAATQDIAVDGWALTMLKKGNVGHASTCNSVGQTAGFFLSNVLFMALESPHFCNTYLRSEPSDQGITTMAGFLFFWGWVFLVSTTLIAVFKKEDVRPETEDNPDGDLKTAYSFLLQIMRLKSVQLLVVILLTAKVGFSAADSVMSLKLLEAGIPKEKLVLMVVPLIPLQIALPLLISKYTTGPRPLSIFVKSIPYRLLFGFVGAFLVWLTPVLVPDPANNVPVFYYVLILLAYSFHQVCMNCMFVSCMAFFAKISDPLVGGTYMTLLNTVTNLGGNWPATLSLWFVDTLTYKSCVGGKNNTDNMCRTRLEQEFCVKNEGQCDTWLDGFYVETLICTVIGIAWLAWAKPKINRVQSMDEYAWKLSNKRTK